MTVPLRLVRPVRLVALGVLTALLAGLLGGLLGGLLALTTAAPAASAGEDEFARIAGCISGADNVLVSIVVDESLSLRDSDPSALRVQGIATAVDSLEQLTGSLEDTRVEVALSTFARDFSTVVDWQRLDADSAEEIRDVAAETLPERDAGDATDYRQALRGGQRLLDARAAELRGESCPVLLWFTDGGLDVDAATAAARTELCQAGGIADSLRADGVAVVALALLGPGISDEQRAELEAVAEGRSSTTSCGTVPIPPGSIAGVYLPATDAAALQRLFGGAGALVAGGTEIAAVRCPGARCPDGTYPLVIDPGVAGARLLIQGSDPEALELTDPSGETRELGDGYSEQLGAAQVDYLVRGGLATLDIEYDPYAPDQQRWEVTPAGRSRLVVYWFWGAELQLDTEELQAGANNQIELRLVDRSGDPLPVDLFSRPQVTVQVGGREVTATLGQDGRVQAEVDLGVKQLPPELPVTASLTARSSPGDVPLGPVTVSSRVPVALPAAYPSVTPAELDFGTLEGVGSATARLTLRGSSLGPTRACVTGARFAVPGEQPRRGMIEAGQRCVDLDRGQNRRLGFTVTTTTAADGVGTGEIRLRVTAADGSEDLQVTVPARLEMQRIVDESTRWLLVVVLIAVAALLPLAMLVGSNLLLARYRMEATARTATAAVQVTPAGVRSLQGSEFVTPDQFDNAPFSGTRTDRRMPLDGTPVTLRARRIWSVQAPEGYAEGPAGQVLVSATSPHRGTEDREAPVELGRVDCCFVIVHPDAASREEAPGTLVMVVPAEVDNRGVHERISRLSAAPIWADLLAELAARRSPVSVAEPGDVASAAGAGSGGGAGAGVGVGIGGSVGSLDALTGSRDDRGDHDGPDRSDDNDDGDDLPPLPDFLR